MKNNSKISKKKFLKILRVVLEIVIVLVVLVMSSIIIDFNWQINHFYSQRNYCYDKLEQIQEECGI